jgi:glucokinase
VIVGGGIAPKILSALSGGAFMRAFCDKGRMATLMADIPVRVAVNPETALLGAASVARHLLGEA